jgi:hypothetical protein
MKNGLQTAQEIQTFYNWVDEYLKKSYQTQFGLDLFTN